jgi:branched-chain amino acid transport system substrate-binding protein
MRLPVLATWLSEKSNRRCCFRLLGVAVVVLAILGAVTNRVSAVDAPDSKTRLKIGLITSLTGPAAEPGRHMLHGVQLYLDQVHNRIAGKTVDLIVENDECSPGTAVSKARKLVDEDHVQIIDGLILAHVGDAVAKHIDKLQVPLVLNSAATDDLTQRHRSPWLVRTAFAASQLGHPFGPYVYNNLKYKRVVTFGMDFPFAWDVIGGFQRTFEDAGGQVVQKIWVPLGFTDFADQLSKIRKDADAVYFANTGAAAERIPKEFRDLGYTMPIIGVGSISDDVFLPHMGDEILGAVTHHTYSPAIDTPANKRFVNAYRAKFNGEAPSNFAEFGYTSMLFIDKAVSSLKGDISDKEKLMTALKHVELTDAPRGPMKTDAFGNPIQNVYVRKVERVHGHLQNTVIATFKDVSQFWKWDPQEYLKEPAYSKDYPPCRHCVTK